MALKYIRPATVNLLRRMPHTMVPVGATGLNANSQPTSRQSPAIRNTALARKPQN
jgi:hypothetical protein